MKRIVTLLFALFPLLASAQDEALFSIDGNSLVWRKVYASETPLDTRAIVYNLRLSGLFKDIMFDDGLVTCEITGLKMQYKELGYKRMSLPIYLSNDTFSGFVSVEIKPDRYRVTVARILRHNDKLGIVPLEDLATKEDGGFKSDFLQPAGRIIAFTLNKVFSALQDNNIGDAW